MPRGPRFDQPQTIYHVTFRGIDGMDIFRSDADRRAFITRFEVVLREEDVSCYGFAALGNHGHGVLRTEEARLGKCMQRVLGPHAGRFNDRYDRRGPLFQDRFWSRPVLTEPYLYELIRYVHLNPLRARIVGTLEELAEYPWCTYGELLGVRAPRLIDADFVLGLFGSEPTVSRRAITEFMASVDPDYEPDWDELAGLKKTSAQDESDGPPEELSALLEHVCAVTGVRLHEIRGGVRTRRVSDARAIAAYGAIASLGLQATVVARYLGASRQAIGKAVGRGRRLAREYGLALPANAALVA